MDLSTKNETSIVAAASYMTSDVFIGSPSLPMTTETLVEVSTSSVTDDLSAELEENRKRTERRRKTSKSERERKEQEEDEQKDCLSQGREECLMLTKKVIDMTPWSDETSCKRDKVAALVERGSHIKS